MTRGAPAASAVGLVVQPMADGAAELARSCASALEGWGMAARTYSSAELEPGAGEDLRLVVTFGGDGTILRTARWLAGRPVPVVGVQMGRLGFLAELLPADLPAALRSYVDGDCWLDRRAMLHAEIEPSAVSRQPSAVSNQPSAPNPQPPTPNPHLGLALNDVVVGRGPSARTVTVDLALGGQPLHQFRCDGLIVATATGSTAYSFAAGGPILSPDSRDLVVTAICPHISSLRTFVLSGDEPLRLQVWTPETAVATVDGQVDHALGDGSVVEVRRSARETLFARRGTPAEFYSRVLSKLG